MSKLGTRVEKSVTSQGPPPIVFAVQPDSYIRLEAPEQLKQWERDLHEFYGIKGLSGMSGAASESCSNGCSDDCDIC